MALIDDIFEIPARAADCLERNRNLALPRDVPYLGMGSSYFAPLTLAYCGVEIEPVLASEYGYFARGNRRDAVLLSQSGESSEVLWARDFFDSFVAVVNAADSTLATDRRARQVVEIHAGTEQFVATKTYVNTLVALYTGLGIDVAPAVARLESSMKTWNAEMADVAGRVAGHMGERPSCSLWVIGSGPNVATAAQSALTLSETTKRAWATMPVAAFDHGPDETADNSVVVVLDGRGRESRRIESVIDSLGGTDALVIHMHQDDVGEHLSPIPLVTKVSLLINELTTRLGIDESFRGGKVTRVDDSARPQMGL